MSTAAQTVKRWKPGGVYMYDLQAMSMADCDEMTFVSWEDYTALERRVQEVEAVKGLAKKLIWALDNIYTIARRESRRSELRPEMWGHVIRLCEEHGAKERAVGILRESAPPDAGGTR